MCGVKVGKNYCQLFLGFCVPKILKSAYFLQKNDGSVAFFETETGVNLGRGVAYSPQCRQRTAILLLQLWQGEVTAAAAAAAEVRRVRR